ncbi:hypothetical protein ACWEWX_37905, partial [Streptomyces asiaticus]
PRRAARRELRSSVAPRGDRHRPVEIGRDQAVRSCDPRSPRGVTATRKAGRGRGGRCGCDPRSPRGVWRSPSGVTVDRNGSVVALVVTGL